MPASEFASLQNVLCAKHASHVQQSKQPQVALSLLVHTLLKDCSSDESYNSKNNNNASATHSSWLLFALCGHDGMPRFSRGAPQERP